MQSSVLERGECSIGLESLGDVLCGNVLSAEAVAAETANRQVEGERLNESREKVSMAVHGC